MFRNITQIVKNKLFFNDSKYRRTQSQALRTMTTMASSCGRKTIYIIKKITSKHYGVFYCLNCFHSFKTKNKLQSQKKVCRNKDFCSIIIPSEYTKILECNQYQKSDKAPFISYADLECIIQKIDGCKNNPENSFTTKVSKYIPLAFSMFTISSFRSIENNHDVYRAKDCMKKFCKFLRDHTNN